MIHTHTPRLHASTERAAQLTLTTASYEAALTNSHGLLQPHQRAALALVLANNTHNHTAGNPATTTK